ncbi:hypothetical protein SAMN05660484_00231 [Eubacterium ruminantium]|uniref:Uncharacterized protein n=1 Tax=Eubacterium ruminantium TaxID=42322 RepID=A0A1T4QV11_9FIRM|nr:hypothetical protein [Eubacterium ruminantium]SCW28261.1 hypothetical protein SAMN05660484_00231 [Eubacterium ruminantium]SDM12153.1 hypothetical protein SAMN04490370_101111 [Eubacterium ruminantium]SKA07620.1 hypothetical protein SAMN02745110_02533 [Eubacterium ruminantium]
MRNSILKRLEALENKKPSDLVISAERDNGEMTSERTKTVISPDGSLKEGFSGVGDNEKGVIIHSGKNLKDLDRILKYFKLQAEKEDRQTDKQEI